MNYNTKNIIKTYAAITGNRDENRIVHVLSQSPTFMAVTSRKRSGHFMVLFKKH